MPTTLEDVLALVAKWEIGNGETFVLANLATDQELKDFDKEATEAVQLSNKNAVVTTARFSGNEIYVSCHGKLTLY